MVGISLNRELVQKPTHAASTVRILRTEAVPAAQGQQSNIRALVDISIAGGFCYYACRVMETAPGRLTVQPAQLRMHDPIQKQNHYRTAGWWPQQYQADIDRAALAAVQKEGGRPQ
jgi:hypothetical protein